MIRFRTIALAGVLAGASGLYAGMVRSSPTPTPLPEVVVVPSEEPFPYTYRVDEPLWEWHHLRWKTTETKVELCPVPEPTALSYVLVMFAMLVMWVVYKITHDDESN